MLRWIKERWIEGDQAMLELASIAGAHTGGFEHISKEVHRRPVEVLLLDLERHVLPAVAPVLEPSLHARLLDAVQAAKLDSVARDTYGDLGSRWRQTWQVTGLDAEFAVLRAMLEAAAASIEAAATSRGQASNVASERAEAETSSPGPTEPEISRRFLVAGEQLKAVRLRQGVAIEDRNVTPEDYQALLDMKDELGITRVPAADTWRRYARAYLTAKFGPANTPRGGRSGRSIVGQDGADNSVPD